MIKTFKGGIHPKDEKHHSKHIKIIDLAAPKIMIFPLSQHLGSPCEPLVSVGDTVKVGQLIGRANGFISANLHSSVSGTVTAIEPRLHSNGANVNSIIIENDGIYEIHESVKQNKILEQLTPEEIVEIIKNAGIVGMGGATFPTHVKLSPPKDKKMDCLIVNGAECEPYLTSDHRVMLEAPENILLGCRAAMKAIGVNKGYIGIESNKKDAIKILKDTVKSFANIEVVEIQTKYPQGSEKQLISAITGKEVPPGGLPLDVGVVVINIDTSAAIATAITTGMPLIKRVVTVSGRAIKNPTNYRVRIGTPAKDVIEAVGGFKCEPSKVIFGGPMMGTAIYSLDVPIIKGCGAIVALTKEEAYLGDEAKCIRCGKCVYACPMKLQPLMLNMNAKKGDLEECEKLNILDCMECGSCSYLCPGRQNPVENIRIAKQKIMQNKKKERK